MKLSFIILIILSAVTQPQSSVVNTAHLDFLYEDITLSGEQMGIIHIYCNYPYDKWTGDEDEGVACIDDAARAAIFYLRYYKYKNDSTALLKAKKLIRFVMYMQAENGFFYNFIQEDHSINKTFRTSVAEPNWWSWRAIWCLSEAFDFFRGLDPPFSDEINSKLKKSIESTLNWLPRETKYADFGGFTLPAWLPYESAADQGAILVVGLSKYSASSGDTSLYNVIRFLSDGLLKMQAGNDSTFPYGAFLSWQNTWHGWGNSQSYALIAAGKLLNNSNYINAAIKEITKFYPYLSTSGYLANFTVEKSGNSVIIKDRQKFSQIAYAIRPMVFASLAAYDETYDDKYKIITGNLLRWFFGDNPAKAIMYSVSTGRGYDGINNSDEVNKNSGAESTIEALLSLLEAERSNIDRSHFEIRNED